MKGGCKVDSTGWELKTRRVKRQFAVAASQVMLESAQEVFQKMIANLKGPHYGVRTTGGGTQVSKRGSQTGKMPIPRVTGTLARSAKMIPLSSVEYAIFADKRVAHYAGYVHDGTKHMKKRPFLRDVIQERRQAIVNRVRYQMLKAIREEGRTV